MTSPSPTRRVRRLGLTLLELLAVIVVISLVISVAGVRLAATGTRARLHAVTARLRDLDAHARLVARSGEPAVLRLDVTQRLVRVHTIPANESLSIVQLPQEISAEIMTSSDQEAIVFDRLGHSQDYRVSLRAGDTVLRWEVYGLTGYMPRSIQGAREVVP